MDTGLHRVEFEAPGRIASTIGKMRGEPSETPENDENRAFLLRMVKRAGLGCVDIQASHMTAAARATNEEKRSASLS